MKYISGMVVIIFSGLLIGCTHQNETDNRTVTVTITDHGGQPLPQYGLQVIDVNGEWLSVPHTTIEGSYEEKIVYQMQADETAIFKFTAPGYLPKYTFLIPGQDSAKFSVRLRSPPLHAERNPQVIGNFNDFDTHNAVGMKKNEDGFWEAYIETELDTLHYFITGYSLFSLPGTDGSIRINEDTPSFDRVYFTELIKDDQETGFTITFNPEVLPLQYTESKMSVDTDSDLTGISKIHTLMIDEHLDMFSTNMLNQIAGRDYQHDFSDFLDKISAIQSRHQHPDIGHAGVIATLRFRNRIETDESELNNLLASLSADSPLWMLNMTAMTEALNRTGLDQHVDLLMDIADQTSFEGLQAEALYNLIRYYHKKGNEDDFHAVYFELTSNHPDYFRLSEIYRNYAPEPPITVGKPLPVNEFRTLSGNDRLHLDELEESYLLIDFWATWCGPCIQAMPALHEIQETYGGGKLFNCRNFHR
jgi:hypothetical protein